MEIEIPALPAGVVTLLAFFAPYAVAIINQPHWSVAVRRIISIVVPLVLVAVVMVVYYSMTGDALPDWPALLLLAVAVTQAAYALVLKPSANAIEARTSREADDTDTV